MENNRHLIVDNAQNILNQVRKVIVGKDSVLLWTLAAILAKGHILLEDIPGVGKTTMVLQYIKQNLSLQDSLYITLDHIYFSTHTLIDVADKFYKEGGKHLIIDEVHKALNWSVQLKQIIDSYPNMQIIFTGSSVLDIYRGVADLSRRAPIYDMQGLSFREYLVLYHGIQAPTLNLDDLINQRVTLPNIEHPLPLFKDYLKRGYYPFERIASDFSTNLMQVINRTMETDIPLYANINISVARKLQNLLVVIAESVPFKPNYKKLAEVTGISRNDIADYIYYMERAGMLMSLHDTTQGIRSIGKSHKLYVDNTNLMYVLSPENIDKGNLRETFFLNQMRVKYPVIASQKADFEIGNYVFEVGGKNKNQKQLDNNPNGYIVKDDIEFGYRNVIPLWAFGLTY
jgi:predicted AAA+ superfamily ATPase